VEEAACPEKHKSKHEKNNKHVKAGMAIQFLESIKKPVNAGLTGFMFKPELILDGVTLL
jgi:hypothetical protein